MFKRSFRKNKVILAILLVGLMVLIGCSSDNSEIVDRSAHGLKVALDIPSQLLADVSLASIEDHMTITEAEVELYKGDNLVESKTLDDPLKNNDIVFSEVEVGEIYAVKAYLKGNIRDESEVVILYQGEATSSEVESDSIINVEVELKPILAKSLTVEEITIEDKTVKTVELKNLGTGNSAKKNYEEDIVFENGVGDLELIPARWDLIITLEEDNEQIIREVLLLPNEEKLIAIRPKTLDDIDRNQTMMQAFYWNMAIDEAKHLGGDEDNYTFYDPAQPYATNYPHEVDLWNYIEESAERYSELGFTGFWLAPPGKAAIDEGEDFYRVGYASYDPWDLGEFSQNSLDESGRTKYGTKDELVAAIVALNEHSIEAYYDIVMNQRLGGRPEVAPVQADLGATPLEGGAWYSTELDEGTEFIISLRENGDNNEFFGEIENVGWYFVEIPANYNRVIFSNDGAEQTENLIIGEDENDDWYSEVNEDKITVYYTNPNDWGTINVHTWEEGVEEQTTEWPGLEMESAANEQFIAVEENEVWIDLNAEDGDARWVYNEGDNSKFKIINMQTEKPEDADELGEVSEGKFRVNIRVWDSNVSNLRVGFDSDGWNWRGVGGLAYYEAVALTDFSDLEGRNKYYNADFEWNWQKFNVIDYCDVRGGIDPVLLFGKEYNDTMGQDFLLGSNIDYANNQNTWQEYKDLATWLVEDIGFDGFRIDAIKHIHTPFMQSWMEHVQEIDHRDLFLVGEDFTGLDGLRATLDGMDEDRSRGLTLFDFQLFFDFQGLGAMNMADLASAGLVNQEGYKDRAVTFVSNHDTERDNYDIARVTNYKYQAYTYILTREYGVPTVFWKDYYQYGMQDGLDKLLEARRDYAYGESWEHPDANDSGVYTYTRLGLDYIEGTGLVMLISNSNAQGDMQERTLYSGRPNVTYEDITGNVDGSVTTNGDGYGEFKVQGSEYNGWSVWVPTEWDVWQ
ncbi:starch-binding protein [Halonatronum saccharophilum]|uniref:starch-binding protein n=1 Tax=Halonatronum saccharophilum TaxID=150060 RepID=UPI0004B18655|nr:starch-binding protein [Halonatronum saccharophilum]